MPGTVTCDHVGQADDRGLIVRCDPSVPSGGAYAVRGSGAASRRRVGAPGNGRGMAPRPVPLRQRSRTLLCASAVAEQAGVSPSGSSSPVQPQTFVAGMLSRPVELCVDTEAFDRRAGDGCPDHGVASAATRARPSGALPRRTAGRRAWLPPAGGEASGDKCSHWLHVLPSVSLSVVPYEHPQNHVIRTLSPGLGV